MSVAGAMGSQGAMTAQVFDVSKITEGLSFGLNKAAEAAKDTAVDFGKLGVVLNVVTDIFRQLGALLNPFTMVANLAPGAMVAFTQVINNLSATMGEALLPILNALTDGLAMFAGFLQPVTRLLGDSFGKLAQVIVEAVVSAFGLLAGVVRLLIVLGKPLGDIAMAFVQGLQELWDTLAVILTALADTLADLVEMFLDFIQFKSLLKLINDVFRELAKTILMVIATLALWLGALGFIDNMIKALTPGGGAQAAGQTSIKGVQDIAKDMALNAAMAGGSTAENEQRKWREETAAMLKEIRDSRPPRDFNEMIMRVGGIVEKQLTKIGGFFETFWNNLYDRAVKPVLQKLGF